MYNDNDKANRDFQKGFDQSQRRRQRENDRLRLRKQTRQQLLKKRRTNNPNNNENNNNNNNNNSNNSNISSFDNTADQMTRKMLQNLPQLVQGCFMNDPNTNFQCCQRIRRLLSIQRNPPISEVIRTGVVPRLMQFVKDGKYDKLQFEALWALTNIASGKAEHTAVVIKHGAIPAFINVMSTTNSREVFEQSIWALGNIAGDSPECRNMVLKANGLSKLLNGLKKYTSLQSKNDLGILRNAVWTISNFCRGKPSPPLNYVSTALPTLVKFLSNTDSEILQDACWAFSYLSDFNDDINNNNKLMKYEQQKVELIMNCGGVIKLVGLLSHNSAHVQHPALRCLGNLITSENNSVTQKIVNMGILTKLGSLLESDKPSIRKEACWTLSNITAGDKSYIESIIKNNLFHILIQILNSNDQRFEIKKEACWALSNATTTGTDGQIRFLVNQGCVPAICSLLDTHNQPTIMVCLEGLLNILLFGEREKKINDNINKPANFIEQCHGLRKLEKLQTRDNLNERIVQKVQNILRRFFDGKDEIIPDDEDEMFNNNNNNNNNFNDNNLFDSDGINEGNINDTNNTTSNNNNNLDDFDMNDNEDDDSNTFTF